MRLSFMDVPALLSRAMFSRTEFCNDWLFNRFGRTGVLLFSFANADGDLEIDG